MIKKILILIFKKTFKNVSKESGGLCKKALIENSIREKTNLRNCNDTLHKGCIDGGR